jgi:hypothetical protein
MLFQSAETIVDVFDRYDLKDSIKSAERERKVPAKYKVCPTGKGLLALANFEINSPRKLINSCLFLLIDKNFFQSAVHALTGCDTTSAIFGIGKKSVFKLINSSSAELSDLSQLKDPDLESRQRTTQVMNWYISPTILNASNRTHQEP